MTSTLVARRAGAKIARHKEWCEWTTLAKNTNWIAVSEYGRALTVNEMGVIPHRVRTIYNPVEVPLPASFEGCVPDKFVLFAGSICEMKGAWILAAAAKRFLQRHEHLSLVLAGPDCKEGGRPVVDQMREIIGESAADRLLYLGHLERPQLIGLMRRAKAFVFPSTFETFGFVAAEAMSQATPVIVANCCAMPEFIEHEKTGFLVEPGDAEGVAAAVDRVLADPDMAKEIGRAARQVIEERFTLTKCVEKTVRFYEKVINERG